MSEDDSAPWIEAARRAQADLPPPPAGDDRIEAGDLIVRGDLPPGAEELASGIEWALVEKDPAAGERYLAVPADGLSLRGSGDLEIGRAGETRTLRCRHPLWLARESKSRWTRTGKLTPTELARARRLLQQLAAGDEVGSLLSREIDESADYRAEIAEPLEQLLEKLQPPEAAIVPLSPRRNSSQGLKTWALAATLLVAVLGFTLVQELDRVAKLRQEQELAESRHAGEVQKLEADKKNLDAAKLKAEQQAAAASATLESTREDLAQARKESVIANPELAILTRPGSTRGPVKIELDPNASHLLVLIPIKSAERRKKYRIELIGGKEPWTSPDLEILSPGELRVGIPASLLPAGEVRLRLRSTQGKVLADYNLVIRAAGLP
jgi:hypothetical protein